MSGAASAVEVAVASDRLSANKLFASDARRAASVGAGVLDRHQASDDERDEQEQHEVQQLPRVGDDDREARLGEQEVIDEERRDGRQDGWDRAGEGTGRHDRDEIDGRRIVDADEFAFEQAR